MPSTGFRSALFSLGDVGADDLRWAPDATDRWPCCELLGIGPRELAVLGEQLGLGGAEELLGRGSLLAGESFEPPWVVSVPEPLRLALEGLTELATVAVAARWSESLPGAAIPDPPRTLAALAAFARVTEGPWALRVDRAGNPTGDGA